MLKYEKVQTTIPRFEKISTNHSYVSILIIVFSVISFQIYLFFETETDDFLLSDAISISVPLVTCIICFGVAKSYGFSDIFGKSIFALGMAILFYFLGEMTYLYYEYVLEIDPFPSFADFFYFLFYPFAVFHLHRNTDYFAANITNNTKILAGIVGAAVIMSFILLTYSSFNDDLFNFFIGLIFVISTAVTMSYAIIGVKAFRQTVLSSSWLLIAIGILLFVIGDVWYYYLEVLESYDYKHPVNMFWITSFGFIIYATIKHVKSL